MNTCEHVNPLIFTSKKKKNCIRKTKKSDTFFSLQKLFLTPGHNIILCQKTKKKSKTIGIFKLKFLDTCRH